MAKLCKTTHHHFVSSTWLSFQLCASSWRSVSYVPAPWRRHVLLNHQVTQAVVEHDHLLKCFCDSESVTNQNANTLCGDAGIQLIDRNCTATCYCNPKAITSIQTNRNCLQCIAGLHKGSILAASMTFLRLWTSKRLWIKPDMPVCLVWIYQYRVGLVLCGTNESYSPPNILLPHTISSPWSAWQKSHTKSHLPYKLVTNSCNSQFLHW